MRIASAPLRVDVTAGFTDLPDIYRETGGVTLNFAIGLRTFVEVIDNEPAHGVGDEAATLYRADPASPIFAERLASGADELLGGRGIRFLAVRTQGPRGCGLGSSAALAVAIVAAAAPELDEESVARLARLAEIKAGNECGLQDEIAAAHGGVSAVQYLPSGPFRRSAVESPGIHAIEEFGSLWLKEAARMSGNIVGQVLADLRAGDPRTVSVLNRINEAYAVLTRAMVEGSAELMIQGIKEAYATQAALHEGIVPAAVSEIVAIVEKTYEGAAKLQGGGGIGGALLTVTPGPPPDGLLTLMASHGYRRLPMVIERRGMVRGEPADPRSSANW